LLDLIREDLPNSFSGLGLIFYVSPLQLPVVALADQALFHPGLPVRGLHAIAQVLTKISVLESPWHDGFHLIDARLPAITHVSQFFAPSVASPRHIETLARPMGARQMAAILGSTLPNVDCTALLAKNGEPTVFVDGVKLSR
jgi:hypothetical protein